MLPIAVPPSPESDSTEFNQTPAIPFCLSMISGQTLRICPEGKPVSTFPDHAPGHITVVKRLIVDVNDPTGLGMEDHRAIVDDRIVMLGHTVAFRHRIGFVSSGRQFPADHDF